MTQGRTPFYSSPLGGTGSMFNHRDFEPPEHPVRGLVAGFVHMCGLTDEHRVSCWGHRAEYFNSAYPDTPFSRLYAAGHTLCGIRRGDGRLLCWGAFEKS